jgi:UDP-N-acetylmuramoyl-tripeptide--D-alanyl-D-alanine ligase
VVVGDGASEIAAGAVALGPSVVMVPDKDAAVSVLRNDLRSGDTVLVKASRGVALETIVDSIREISGGVETAAGLGAKEDR